MMEFKQSVGYIISNTGRRLNQRLQQLFLEHDVTPEQWSLLMCLEEHNGITHKDLAMRTDKDPANITRLVDQLERKSLVSRVANPADRRSQLLFTTDKGKISAKILAPIEEEFVSKMLSNISVQEIEAFKSFMAKINTNSELH
jgi:DNA-binding MarR family transcriptional regulator